MDPLGMSSRRSQPPTFDLHRHLMQLVRHVLPIFVLVLAAGFVISVVMGPDEDSPAEPVETLPARVGLLPVESADGRLPFDPAFAIPRPIELARVPVAARFDLPLGSPLGALTYNAQPFLTSRHLGDDFNGIGGRDSDRGDPVHAAADGEIAFSGWAGDGWGNVVIIWHRLPSGESVSTLYGHLDRIRLAAGGTVRRGERLGTVGKADGRYLAHLHFEVRGTGSLDPGPGYGEAPSGRHSGETFVAKYRGAPDDRQNPALGSAWDTRIPKTAEPGESPEAEGTSIRISTETPATRPAPSDK